eukprot:TRINITY_DN3114_c0_g1_i1.p1 TRINITY_DN3114_c0_g1~~TRINITY_DN3114_c0_g1_i1.p1  ORF type:complete len:400 (+),score=100.36 TRINITY_DN3114_c0_g1_i1:51-1202(+)
MDTISEGYFVIEGAAKPEACEALRQHIRVKTREAQLMQDEKRFGKIREPDNRYDLLLDMDNAVVDVVNDVIASAKECLSHTVGVAGRLIELAAITSHPGARSQPVHADTVHGVLRFLQADTTAMTTMLALDDEDDNEAATQVLHAVATDTAQMWSMLVALQDVDEDMGPTHVWPGTNTLDHHSRCYSHYAGPGGDIGGQTTSRSKLDIEAADDLFQVPHKKMTISSGSFVAYDSRLMHCGGANTSKKSRTVLVMTFIGAGMLPEGSTYDLLPKLTNKYRLSSFPLEKDGTPQPKLQCDIDEDDRLEAIRVAEEEERNKAKPVPPLNEWRASVQCTKCGKWRPSDPSEADAKTRDVWKCATDGFSCFTDQLYTVDEIDRWFEED